jgi:rhamnogalacturonyl hydrolase YesR
MRHADDFRFQKILEKGFDYYIRTFFTPDGQSKYYNNALYPIDVHAPTQLVFTLHELGNTANHRALLENVLDWTIRHMQSNHGYFYYRINRWHTNKIPYMRWSQAWMFYALAVHLKTISNQ